MTREEVKAQLAKTPLVWKEEEGRPVYGLHSRVTLIDGEDGDEDAYDALRIDFHGVFSDKYGKAVAESFLDALHATPKE